MFAKSMPSNFSDARKRKSVFADDKQPWPSDAYKRQCRHHAARDERVAYFGLQVSGADGSAYVWVPKANWQARYTACGSIPMQRVLRRSLEPTSALEAAKENKLSPHPMRPPLLRFEGFYDLEMQAEDLWIEDALNDTYGSLLEKTNVAVRSTGPLVALPGYYR